MMISVIVPLYNAENYLQRCVDSILRQTYRDFEVILVDDGSKDKSVELCELYKEKDSRVRVIHKHNGGVAEARQYGVNTALGEYIIHVDADDWIEPDMLQEMIKAIGDADILIADYYLNARNGNQKSIIQKDCTSSLEMLESIIKGDVFGSLWNKLIRRDLYDIAQFKSDVFFCEDQLFLFEILSTGNYVIRNIHKPYYHYVDSEGSLTRRTDKSLFENKLRYEDYALKILNDEQLNHIRELFIIDRIKSYEGIVRYGFYSSSELKETINRFPKVFSIKNIIYVCIIKNVLLFLNSIRINRLTYVIIVKVLKKIRFL